MGLQPNQRPPGHSPLSALNDPHLVWRVPQALTVDESARLIARAEAEGFRVVGDGTPRERTRKNRRVVAFDSALADVLFERIRNAIPTELVGMAPVRCNECMRYYRYDTSDYFRPHQDTDYFISPDERSLLSVVVYLNAEYIGGELALTKTDEVIQPTTGLAVVFGHRVVHESRPIVSGVKYAMRSDVVYRRSTVG